MEVQIFYRDKDSNIVIICFLIDGDELSQQNVFIDFENIPDTGKSVIMDEINYYSLFKRKEQNLEELDIALEKLNYDKHYPLDQFFMYEGSLMYPPCRENITYIINATIMKISFNQILNISKSILINNPDGNYRNIQNMNYRKVYHYFNKNKFNKQYFEK
jgi:hypothetical protein